MTDVLEEGSTVPKQTDKRTWLNWVEQGTAKMSPPPTPLHIPKPITLQSVTLGMHSLLYTFIALHSADSTRIVDGIWFGFNAAFNTYGSLVLVCHTVWMARQNSRELPISDQEATASRVTYAGLKE